MHKPVPAQSMPASTSTTQCSPRYTIAIHIPTGMKMVGQVFLLQKKIRNSEAKVDHAACSDGMAATGLDPMRSAVNDMVCGARSMFSPKTNRSRSMGSRNPCSLASQGGMTGKRQQVARPKNVNPTNPLVKALNVGFVFWLFFTAFLVYY